jgi:hypothetical protein
VKYSIPKIKYSVEEKLFIYDTFVHCSSWKKCCRKDPDSTVLCKATIYNKVTKLHSTGLVLDKKKSQKRHALTEEKL